MPVLSEDMSNLAHTGGRWTLTPARQKLHVQIILCEMVSRVQYKNLTEAILEFRWFLHITKDSNTSVIISGAMSFKL